MKYQEQIKPLWTLVIAASASLLTLLISHFSGNSMAALLGSITSLVIIAATSFFVVMSLTRSIGGHPAYASDIAKKIAMGDQDFEINTNSGDSSSLMVTLRTLQEKLKIQQQEQVESTALSQRIKLALDVCDTNVMMADESLDIVYMNKSVKSMMLAAEADLRNELPGFDAKNLMGKNIDIFHKNPAHQRTMLAALRDTYHGKINVGGRTFNLTATPIFNEESRIGTVVEWDDITEKLAKEKIEEQLSSDNARIKSALDVCDTNVMMADTNLNIVYMNNAVQQMMQTAEEDLKQDLPNFNARNLIGANIDVFHKNPTHQRGLLESLKEVYRTHITVGGRTFELIATPIFDQQNQRLGTVVEWDDMTVQLAREQKEQHLANENASIKLALDVCDTNVMMADADFNINYMNTSVQNMMRLAESDLKTVLPNFDANKLIGNNIDVFHKNPAHQRSMLASLSDTYRTEINVGPRTFSLTATPIFNDSRERLGTVVEWSDRSDEVSIENEMDNLVNAANDGDLSKRLDTTNKTGFFKRLSEGLNSLLNNTESFIDDVGKVFEAMSQGDLSQQVNHEYQGEFDRIKLNANNSVDKLSEVLSKIQASSRTVGTSADEVAQGTDDLSRRTESQASSLQETAASMEEITATVKQTAESATQSNVLAAEAKTKAEQGGEVVQGAVVAMSEILDSSNKINDIIGVIDEIAFQTNLLALNAAVEAARAGEQGRGFAVVAGEVRTLSQRSAAAAKEIKDLIRDSVNKVESGSALVNQSGQMLTEIVNAVDNVARMINDVNTAAREQNSGISQINQAITQMDEMTQQNAALVEESSAASRSMSDEARSMNNLIGFFNFKDSPSHQNTASNSEPIKSYQPLSGSHPPASHNKSQSSNKNPSGSDAASFSKNDEWEDF